MTDDGADTDAGTDRAPDGARGISIRSEIAAWIEAWGTEVAAADIRSGRERFDPGMLAFGTHADVVEGRDAVEAAQWSQIWPAIDDFAFDLGDLRVLASADGTLAVAIVTWRSTGIHPDGVRYPRPGRATVVLRRDAPGTPWVGVHTHFSLARGVPPTTHGRRDAIR